MKNYFLKKGITVKATYPLPDYYMCNGVALSRVLVETDQDRVYIVYLDENGEAKFHLNGGV